MLDIFRNITGRYSIAYFYWFVEYFSSIFCVSFLLDILRKFLLDIFWNNLALSYWKILVSILRKICADHSPEFPRDIWKQAKQALCQIEMCKPWENLNLEFFQFSKFIIVFLFITKKKAKQFALDRCIRS
jgi:hypothetical protein